MEVFVNPTVDRRASFHGLFQESAYRAVADFYDSRPSLTPTPLHSLPALAAHLSLADVLIKDETRRFGLEAFKIAGALYAMRTLGAAGLSRGVVCATAGNHGRAVARAAREIGCACTVFVPAEHPRATERERRTRAARIDGMRRDGAVTSDVAGSYEDAVARATDHARHTGACVVSDTSWEGYETIPRAIMSGYTRLFEEAHQQWTRAPDVVLIQGGVGGLVCAAANWFSWRYGSRRPYLIACEPESAACLLESARAGRAATVQASKPGEVPTMMAGLRCAAPSPAAWPSIQAGIDAFVSVSDAIVEEALDILSHPRAGDTRIISGPSGACGLGALLALLSTPELDVVRRIGALNRSIRVMVVVTEGP